MSTQTRWGAVFALTVAGVIVALQIGKAAIALPVLQRELSLSLVAASWIVGAYGVLGAVGGLPAGILSSLFDARRTMLAGLIAAGVGSLAGAMVESGPFLIATRVIEGCGFLAAALTIPRLLRAVTAPKDLGTVLALFAAYLPAGSVIMMVAGPHLMAFGWQTLWLVNGAVALLYAAAISRIDVREPPKAPHPAAALGPNIRAVLRTPGPILLALTFSIYTFQYMAIAGLLPTLLVERLGLSISTAGIISAVTVMANAVGNMSAGALLRLGVPTWTIVAGVFTFAGCASFGVFSDAMPIAVIAVLASLSLGLTGMIPGSIYAAAPRFAPTSAVMAIVFGLINQATNIGNLAGPPVMAWVVQSLGWNGAPVLFVCVAVLGVVLALALRTVLRRAAPVTST